MNILVFDDHAGELDEISAGLVAAFRAADVTKAQYPETVRSVVDAWVLEGQRLDIAVLDIWVERTSTYELDIPCVIRELFPDSLVVHYTAHKVADPIRERDEMKFGAHDEIIAKGEEGGTRVLHELIRQYWEHQLVQGARQCFDLANTHRRPSGVLSLPSFRSIPCDTIEANTLLSEISHFRRHFSADGLRAIEKYVKFKKKKNKWLAEPKISE